MDEDPEVRARRAKARRTALVIGIIAVSIYFGQMILRTFR